MADNRPGSTVCFNCGRVTLGAAGLSIRVHPSAPPSQYAGQTHRGAGPGVGRRIEGGARRRSKKRSKNLRNLALVLAVAFVFLFTPAQEQIITQLNKWMNEILKDYGPAHNYPVQSQYTLERRVILTSGQAEDFNFHYSLPIPFDRTERGISTDGFQLTGGGSTPVMSLQLLSGMTVNSPGGPGITIPLDGTTLSSGDAVQLTDWDTEVFWPSAGDDNDHCDTGPCVIWRGAIPTATEKILVVTYELTSTTFSWWDEASLDAIIPGAHNGRGLNAGNSGTFDDLDRAGHLASTHLAIGQVAQWNDRASGSAEDWAIDGTEAYVQQIADQIQSSLGPLEQDNVFAFSHAAFIYVRDTVMYDVGLATPRSGPDCLIDGRGDCDEQANAWMSILRTREISTWYEFGALTDNDFSYWEPHAWANVLLPLSENWCNAMGIQISSCWVEASVDVVNNKWLLHTPTGFSEWVESASPSGIDAYKFYRPLSVSAYQYIWTEKWDTTVGPVISGGTYRVPYLIGQ